MSEKLKVWVAGYKGQMGTAINEMADPAVMELCNTDKAEVDITKLNDTLAFAGKLKPDVIINCAAVTDTQICMINPEAAYRVNALGARNLAIAARENDCKIVQLSTDDVFDGTADKPYHEFEDTHPKSVYGRSKRAGERYVKEFTYRHFIFRSSWIYGKRGNNFVQTLLKRTLTETELTVASDQFGSPTSANELAKLILKLITTKEYGLYHATCKGVCSRYEFAQEILRLSGRSKRITLKPVATPDAEISSARPAYTVLDNFILDILGGYEFPDWKDALKEYLDHLKKEDF